jgi:hypothetical protein
MSALRLVCWLAIASWLPTAAAQLPLADLAKVARARAERSRPAQQKAMEPFWPDLQLNYRDNAQFLDNRIREVVALGDSVVPLLLEKLQPAQGGDAARHLAGNCRRALERLDPASFVDALAELAAGSNEVARTEAIRLLGFAPTAQATGLLVDLLDRTQDDDKRLVVRALMKQQAASAAPKVAPMLASNDRNVREDVLAYLVAAKPPQVVDTVLQALSTERDNKLLPSYVEYLAAAVAGHDGAARALLPLLDRERLEWQDTKRLVQALASVAPANHEPTCQRLHVMIDAGETNSIGVQAALTLRALGDGKGVDKLRRTLNEQLRKPQRKKEPGLYEQRGNLLLAIEDYADAYADFEKMLEYANDESAMGRRAHGGMMRVEARRKKVAALLKLIKASNMTAEEIEAIGNDDPVFAETLQQDKVRAALQALGKDGPGK